MVSMRFVVLMLMFCVPLFLAAQIGPNVSVYKGEELKWEEGAHDFFVMWKSLVARTDGSVDTGPSNPQADSCIDPNVGSTYTLNEGVIPPNATVERAFLVWMAVVDPTQLSAPVKNSATLSFQHLTEPALSYTQEVTASVTGTLSSTSSKDFEFEGILTQDPSGGQDGIFTYRVEVTDFLRKIQEDGNALGMLDSSYTLVGNYTVRGVPCSAAEVYKTSSGLMAGWSLIIIYSAEGIHAKKIYVYNGLAAYRFTSADIMISGFQLPNEAIIRMTLFVGEGDPGLYTATNPNMEGLQLHGPIDPNAPWLPLFDVCNPNLGSYVEVYNSISSVWPAGATQPVCVGDINTKQLEYAMDVDTFLINAKDYPFSDHLHKDDQVFWLKIGANQDQVYTNFLVLSIDTRPPSFDIPEGTTFAPNGREKDHCTCAPAGEPDRVCPDRPFYYVIRVQNWGENVADNVTVQDTLPPEVEYIPGTTEMATSFDGVNGTNWTPISDNGGAFPLNSPYQVWATGMGYCDPVALTCPDSVLIRFKVQPKSGLPKHQLIKNSAYIADATGISYQTNTSVPLTLRISDSCPPITECPEPPKSLCGGESSGSSGCTSKEQCGPNQDCIDGKCVDISTGEVCATANVQYRIGDLSPSNGASRIIIPSPSTNLVVAQIALNGTCSDGVPKGFHLDMFRPRFNFETGVALTNLRLVKDTNNNGAVDDGEPVISSVAALDTNKYARFVIASDQRFFVTNTDHNLLVVTDAAYTAASIPMNAEFWMSVEGSISFVTPSDESVTLSDTPLTFNKFMFEPSTGYFIFTKATEPAEPPYNQINKSNTIFHIRAKSLDGENQIRDIDIRTVGDSTFFGEGMQAIDIYEDSNGDGIGDTLAATSGTFSTPTDTYTFEVGSNPYFTFSNQQQRYYTIAVTFSLESGMTAQVQIPSKGVRLNDTTKKVIELPIQSRAYQCVNPFCEGGSSGGGGCSCALVADNEEKETTVVTFVVSVAAVLALFLRHLRRRQHSL